MGEWTITSSGVEKTLEKWGLSDGRRTRKSQTASAVTLLADGRAVDAAELFAYGSTVIVQKDRVWNGTIWGGGSRWFYGRVANWERNGSADSENQICSLVDPWWYLQELLFEHSFKNFGGYVVPNDPSSGVVLVTVTSSHLFLNQAVDLIAHPNGKLTTGEQIAEAVQWAISKGAPIQIGTISPDVDPPIDEDKQLTCEGVIHKMLAYTPDAVTYFDYTTLPYPTLHIRRLAELDSVSFDLNAGNLITGVRVKERPDWKRPFVRIVYEQSNNGVLQSVEDVWPNPLPSDPEKQFGGLVSTVNLAGNSVSSQFSDIVCERIDTLDLEWWRKHVNDINRYRLQGTTDNSLPNNLGVIELIPTPTFTDLDTNLPADGSLVFECKKGTIFDWMIQQQGVKASRVRVSIPYNLYPKSGDRKLGLQLSQEMTLVNVPSGHFTTRTTLGVADPVPVNLARDLYEALNALSAEGDFTIIEEEVGDTFAVWKRVNFITPDQPGWATLDAMPQTIEETALQGETRVDFGAPEILGAKDLVALLQVHRGQTVLNSLSMRKTGDMGSGGAVSGATFTPDKNSGSGKEGWNETLVATSNPANAGGSSVKMDGVSALITLESRDGSGAVTPGGVRIALADTFGNDVRLREVGPFCIDGVEHYIIMLASQFYSR